MLAKYLAEFQNSNFALLKIGAELEFFLFHQNKQPVTKDNLEEFINNIKTPLKQNFNLIYEIKEEQGQGQIEVNFAHNLDLEELVKQIQNSKNFIQDFASKNGYIADFSAKPILDDCASALQFNISLHDKENEELISNKDSKYCNNIIAGLIKLTPDFLEIAAPNKEDLLRFDLKNNQELFKKGKYVAPTNISYGYDNRTCLIRYLNNRIEYRLFSANSNAEDALVAIMQSILLGIQEDLHPTQLGYEKIYGNSFHFNPSTTLLGSKI